MFFSIIADETGKSKTKMENTAAPGKLAGQWLQCFGKYGKMALQILAKRAKIGQTQETKEVTLMMKRYLLLLLAAAVLAGCASPAVAQPAGQPSQAQTEPAPSLPPDGQPGTVTSKGSYTGTGQQDTVVASVGKAQLTNGLLSAFYWAEAAAWLQAGHPQSPDFSQPLDIQSCPVDSSVHSWQQFFLRRALNAWHTSQALVEQSKNDLVPTEEAYRPNPANREKYLDGMPATRVLYGYDPHYRINTMHQAYLDALPQHLQELAEQAGASTVEALARQGFGTDAEDLEDFARLYNEGYAYYTFLSYDRMPTEEEVQAYSQRHPSAEPQTLVDIRQVLLVPSSQIPDPNQTRIPGVPLQMQHEPVQIDPDGRVSCSEEAWEYCLQQAQSLLEGWKRDGRTGEAAFAELANKHSQDPLTALDGGVLRNLRQGQLIQPLDSWCFDPARQSGDTTIVRSDYGIHILYFSASREQAQLDAQKALGQQALAQILDKARRAYPVQIDYSAIVLPEAQPMVSTGDILYPDLAHQRYPEIPLYLQQDYEGTMYGGFQLATNGCGITSFAMLASYLLDEEWTPPEMCQRYGNYSYANGTDGMIYSYEPQVMGFYLRERTHEPTEAYQALKEGYPVISLQHKGYWTRGGHYILLEKLNDDGTVQVRDSNVYNYGGHGRANGHVQDRHEWKAITGSCGGFWVFDRKVTNLPACARCGDGDTRTLLQSSYLCPKCRQALLRREGYLDMEN